MITGQEAGNRRQVFTIRSYGTGVIDSNGDVTRTWADLKTIRGSWRTPRGTESIENDKALSVTNGICVFNKGDAYDITPEMRIQYNSTDYDIISILPNADNDRYIQFTVAAVSDG